MSQKSESIRIKLETLEDTIKENFPDFQVNTIKMLGEGRMSIAVLVNDEWVFRFPKEKNGADDLKKEIRTLPHLTKQITLAIPQFQYVGNQKNGFPFVGYKKLSGDILGEDALPSFSKEERKVIARQIAKFIDEVSAFPIDKAIELGVPKVNIHKEFVEKYAKVKQVVYPLVDIQMQQYISSRFEAFLGSPLHFQYKPTLIHADLSPDHYLFDPIERILTGIIDFGDMSISDPDYEYLYILEDCGEDFARQVIESKHHDQIEERLKKVKYFVTFDHVAFILEGIKRENQHWIDEGVDAIRSEMFSSLC